AAAHLAKDEITNPVSSTRRVSKRHRRLHGGRRRRRLESPDTSGCPREDRRQDVSAAAPCP
ncbi:hypothetical protein ABZP36_025576, partial [Zizania latifolia]